MNFKNKFKQFSYLYNLEIINSLKIVLPALVMILIFRLSMFRSVCNSVKNEFYNWITYNNGTLETYLLNYDKTSQVRLYEYNTIVEVPLMLGVALVIIYAIIIWLKEWMGNNRTVYSMMTLPIPKSITLLSKLATCVGVFVMFYATQILALFIERGLFKWIVPKEIIKNEGLVESVLKSGAHNLLIISGKDIFLGALGILVVITIVFIEVLLERSFGIFSIFINAVILFAIVAIGLMPVLFGVFSGEYLLFLILYSVVIIVLGFMLCKYLLEKKFMYRRG